MALIQIRNLTFGYEGTGSNVFDNLTVQLDTSWRLGVVGNNGRGKTTLLRLLKGDLIGTGELRVPEQCRYFPPVVPDSPGTVRDVLCRLCPEAEVWQMERELGWMDMDMHLLDRPFTELSGGECTKVLLASLFLDEGGALPLIDEPTNHLDADGRRQVAEYLHSKSGFILVSHDRQFLDECIDHVLAINRTDVELAASDFSTWKREFDRRQEGELQRNERLRADIRRLSESARTKAAWSERTERSKRGAGDKGYVGHKAAKMMQRSKNLERRRNRAVEEKAGLLQDLEETPALQIQALKHPAEYLIRVHDAVLHRDQTSIGPIGFCLKCGDRISLEGPNGVGKSTLLNVLSRTEVVPYSGTVEMASGLRISWVPQNTSGLPSSLMDVVSSRGLDRTRFFTVLRKLGFERDLFERSTAQMSEGQRKKILLAASICESAHVYLWDEPLNYLDVNARIQVEEVLSHCAPTMIFIEHDRAFREAVGTERVILE